MRRPNRNPLSSASLATDEEQGVGAKACGQCEVENSAHEAKVRVVVLAGIDALLALLDTQALQTVSPPVGFLEAADELDDARSHMAQGGGL